MSVKVKFTQYEIEKLRDCLGVLSSVESVRSCVNCSNYSERLAVGLFNLWVDGSDAVGNVEFDVMAHALNKMLKAIDTYDYINPITDAVELKKIKALKDKLMQAVADCGESWP